MTSGTAGYGLAKGGGESGAERRHSSVAAVKRNKRVNGRMDSALSCAPTHAPAFSHPPTRLSSGPRNTTHATLQRFAKK